MENTKKGTKSLGLFRFLKYTLPPFPQGHGIYISLPNHLWYDQKLMTARAIFLLSDICFMRFDFINFDFGLDYTNKATYGACHDKFSVDIDATVGTDPPAICGKNNGYHSKLNWI